MVQKEGSISLHAVHGSAVLSEVDIEKHILELDGKWKFVPENQTDGNIVRYVDVPVIWNDARKQKANFEAGTYYLKLHLPREGIYAFYINFLPCSYQLYINDNLIGQSGQMSPDLRENDVVWDTRSVETYIDKKDITIKLVTSKIYCEATGSIRGILFGDTKNMDRVYTLTIARSAIFIGMFLGFGMYLLLMYEPGSKRKSYFYLGFFSIGIMFLELLIGVYIGGYFWENPSQFLYSKAEVLLVCICCTLFCLFEQESNKIQYKIPVYVVNGINVAYLFLTVISNMTMLKVLKQNYIKLFCVTVVFSFTFAIKSLIERQKYSVLNIFSYCTIAGASLFDMLAGTKGRNSFSYSGNYSVGILFFLLCQMYLVSRKSIDEFHQSTEKKDMEIAFLQVQIAPHFFFNTLNNIYCMMDTCQEKAKSILMDFCDFLRVKYKFDYRTEVYYTLEEEADMVAAFVRIENERYNHKIEFTEVIDESCKKIMIPPLLLQPIVENAIKHGMTGQKLSICLTVKKKGTMAEVLIEDNGKGMGMDQVNKILNHQLSSTGIGLDNTNYRLNKCYHTKLSIESSIGNGTQVKLKIPLEGRR